MHGVSRHMEERAVPVVGPSPRAARGKEEVGGERLVFRRMAAAPPLRDFGDVTWVLSRTVGRGSPTGTPVWVTVFGMKTPCLEVRQGIADTGDKGTPRPDLLRKKMVS